MLGNILLSDLPRTETAHQLRVIVSLLDNDSALTFEDVFETVDHVLGGLRVLLLLKLFLELLGLLHSVLLRSHLGLEKELLALLLDDPSIVDRLELLGQVADKCSLLLLGHFFILVSSLELFFALLDTCTQVGSIFLHLHLLLTLPFEHVLIVGELIGEILLKGVLHRLLLKLDVPETALLLLLLLTFVFLKRLLVSCGLAINQVLITNQLTTQFTLIVRHLGAEVHLLGCVLLLELLPQSSLLILVRVLNLEVDLTKNVLLVQAQILEHILVLFVGNLILDIVKLFLFDPEVLLNSISLSVLLVGILAKK